MTNAALVVFARAPIEGRVKSRLAATLGAAQATRVYAALLALALRRAAAWSGPRAVACADESSLAFFRNFPATAGFDCFLQEGADLGTRMRAALRQGLASAPAAVLIGTDVPDHSPEDLPAARALLGEADVVLGPVADGGYWLIGVRGDHPTLFEGIPWSSAQVLSATLARSAGLQLRLLPVRHDVDDAASPWLNSQGELRQEKACERDPRVAEPR